METKTTAKKWTATDAGPIQCKRINKAANKLAAFAKTFIRLTGTHGEPEHEDRCRIYTPFENDCNPKARELAHAIGERFEWTVTKKNAKAIADAYLEALPEAGEACPVKDERQTQAEREERSERIRAYDAKRKEEQETKAGALDPIMAKRPTWAAALIVAELDVDECESQTDYFAHGTNRAVAIGWRKGKRNSFGQLRAAAASFEPTAHMGPGCDTYTAWAYTQPDEGPNVFRNRQAFRDDSYRDLQFTTRAALEAAVAAAIKAAAEVEPPKACVWGDHAGAYGFEVECSSVEHRDNYSMGAGNYLKGGHTHSSGWRVRSYPLGDDGTLGYGPLRTLEDALPDRASTPKSGNAAPAGSVEGDGYTVQEAANKRGPFWLVVATGERMERETFNATRTSASAAGGWYSRKWGRQPGGFGFNDSSAAQAWAVDSFGGAS